MKRIVVWICTGVLVLSLTACGGKDEVAYTEEVVNTETAAEKIFVGKVTAVDGNVVTVQPGEMTELQGMEPGGKGQDGQQPEGEMPEPPEKPDGADQQGQAQDDEMPTPPEGMPGRDNFTAVGEAVEYDLSEADIRKENGMDSTDSSVSEIQVDDILEFTIGSDNRVMEVLIKSPGMEMGGFGGGGFGGSAGVTQGTAANTIDTDGEYASCIYASTGDDENALRIEGAAVTLSDVKIEKTAGTTSNTENGDFYGMNAALLATDGAQLTISKGTVSSSAQNGNGVFSYGSGTVVNISDSTITTTADNSGGIQTTGGGTTNASNLTVNTSGNSSAAIRSDRGGGIVNVDGGSYVSNGYNSPAVYSTAAITVKNATLTANHSEALVIEGKNSIALENCNVVGNMSNDKGTSSDENVHNVMIYQSMSGDAEVGTSSFSMTGGTLTSQNGDMFYITNTHALVTLSEVNLVNEDTDGYLMRVSGNSASRGWGKAGTNGAQVEFTANRQELSGDIVVDTISTLNMTLSDGSSFVGTINIIENEQKGAAVEENAVVVINSGCTWTLTGDCTLTSLTNNGTVEFNGYSITLADGTVLK